MLEMIMTARGNSVSSMVTPPTVVDPSAALPSVLLAGCSSFSISTTGTSSMFAFSSSAMMFSVVFIRIRCNLFVVG